MLTVKQIKDKMKDRKIRTVSAAIGVHENTVYTFMRSENPRTRTAELLSDYLEGKDNA